ncbi:MAG: hypothetical protein RR512_02610 [Coprobacillus sp.]
MSLPNVNPLILDELLIAISAGFMECFSPDEQAVIGTFLATLGSVISFNSVYILYIQGQNPPTDNQQDSSDEENKDDNNKNEEWELIKKSIDKIQERLKNIEKSKQ